MQVKAIVSLKDGVLDPQAKAIYHALHSCGFSMLKDIKLAREITLELDTDDEATALRIVDEMCKELLANLVIEDYRVQRPQL